MKYLIILLTLSMIFFIPSYGQSDKNPSLIIQTIKIPHNDFNKVARDIIIVNLEKPHTISWQVTVRNNLLYANPDGNAVIRFYDVTIPEKFIEVGMGSHPDEKFWVAVNIPGDTEYVIVHSKLERGWIVGLPIILAYTEKAGLTVNNGERIVLSNLDVGSFKIGSYSVYGMENSQDPPAVNSGELVLDFLSGDPSENQFHLFPFFLTAGIGGLIAVLLVTKKRS